jgi:CubicO group peptidase (beta-lactamase class C family)
MLSYKKIVIVLMVMALAVLIAPALASTPLPTPSEPWAWAYSTPEEQGMRSEELVTLLQTFTQPHFNVNNLIVARHGYIVAEVHGHPDVTNTPREIMSVSKSVVATLVGIALDQGYLKSLDDNVLSFFPEYSPANMDERKAAMTVRDLLTMGSGFKCNYYVPGTDEFNSIANNMTQQCLDKPMAYQPGEKFQYCQCNTYLLASILARQTKMDVMDFAKQNLFAPLDITNVTWQKTNEGIIEGFIGLHISPHDMAKIGYLYLHKGQWEGKQIISSQFAADATSPQIATDWPDTGYGYQWWYLKSANAAIAIGLSGQYILVNPTKDIVVVLTSELTDVGVIRPALQGYPMAYAVAKLTADAAALPANPDGVAKIKALADALANPKAQPVSPLPALAKRLSGQTWDMMSPLILTNRADMRRGTSLAVEAFSLEFNAPDRAMLTLIPVEGEAITVAVGLDGVYRVSDQDGWMVGAKGLWLTETDFRLFLKYLDKPNLLRLDFAFMPGAVNIVVNNYANGDVAAFFAMPAQ